MNRRQLLQAMLSAAPVFWLGQASANTPSRIVTLSWELTETLLALGHTPVATALPDWYRRTIVEPPLPQGVANIGLLYQPNFEVLRDLAPDLLILTPGHFSLQPALARLAPTLTLGRYMDAEQPYPALLDDTRTLAQALNETVRAEQLIADTQRCFTTVLDPRPTFVADAVDGHFLRVYGQGSLFDAVMQTRGMTNGATVAGLATHAGGSALVPVQRLASVTEANLLLVGPVAPGVRAALQRSPVWQALPCVRGRRVAELPVIAPYGGLVSMQRFARALDAALVQMAHREPGLV
ncbi:MAG: Iron(3+)-hydroxamate-binding protein FhuD [Pseudomonas fluorescens]|nr:MAG: Iron(3+)-hydroxamate-binding protein FhuD [Pseudomonas fluorescens]